MMLTFSEFGYRIQDTDVKKMFTIFNTIEVLYDLKTIKNVSN